MPSFVIRPISIVIALVTCFGAAMATEPRTLNTDISPNWGALDALPLTDQKAARQAASEMEGWDPDERTIATLRKEMRASTLKLESGDSLLFLKTISFGNCGDIIVRILGPGNSDGQRKPILNDTCLSDIRVRPHPGQNFPDLITTVSDLTDEVMHWDGSGWHKSEIIESLKPRAPGSSPDLSLGPLAHLKPLAGTYDVITALNDPLVDAALRKGLGTNYVTFLQNLSARPPWDYVQNCLTVTGQAPHQGGVEEAILSVCMNGKVHAAILTDGPEIILYSPARSYKEVPDLVRAFIGRNHIGLEPPNQDFTWRR